MVYNFDQICFLSSKLRVEGEQIKEGTMGVVGLPSHIFVLFVTKLKSLIFNKRKIKERVLLMHQIKRVSHQRLRSSGHVAFMCYSLNSLCVLLCGIVPETWR